MQPDPFAGRDSISSDEYRAYLASQGQTVLVPPIEEGVPDWQTSEKAFMARVVKFATERRFRTYHTWKSANSSPGYPDLCLCRVGENGVARLIFAELKLESGRVSPDQRQWLDDLSKVSGVEVYVWRPADWESIQDNLK